MRVLFLLLFCATVAVAAERSPRVKDFVGDGADAPTHVPDCNGQRIRRDPLYGTLSYGACRAPAPEVAPRSRGTFRRGKLTREGSVLDRVRGVPFTNPPNR